MAAQPQVSPARLRLRTLSFLAAPLEPAAPALLHPLKSSSAIYMAQTRRGTKRKSGDDTSDKNKYRECSSGSNDSSVEEEEEKPSVKKGKKVRQVQRPRTENFTLRNNIRKDGIYPMNKFPYHLNYKQLNLRKQPQLYRPGVGEQGVLMVEPYKSELLPDWKFKNPEVATKSSETLRKHFKRYIEQDDFVGADMARKFIQMGFTRSRRYANHTGGRKYSYADGGKGKELPKAQVEDPDKAESARIFKAVLEEVKVDAGYLELRRQFEKKYKDVVIIDDALEEQQ